MVPIPILILSLISLVNWNICSQDTSSKTQYFQNLPDINDPNSLSDEVSKEMMDVMSEYFVSYSDKTNQIDSIKHFKERVVVAVHVYEYQGKAVSKITSSYYQDNDFMKCITAISKEDRETECFNLTGQIVSKEYFNMKTKYYSIENYDSTGTLTHHEWGKYD